LALSNTFKADLEEKVKDISKRIGRLMNELSRAKDVMKEIRLSALK